MDFAGTILLADNNRDDVLLMRCALRRAGFDLPISVVEDGEAAVDYLRGRGRFSDRHVYPNPSLVMLDLRLPRMDGLEVLHWIREQPQFKDLPVVIMTGARSDWQARHAAALGASSCIIKPLGYKDLVSLVRTQVGCYLTGVSVAA